MRHVRARRRFKVLLTAFLTFSMMLFLESKVESFAPQVKFLAESKIEEALDKKVKLSFGTLDGGIVNPFTVNGCLLLDQNGSPLLPHVEIKSIRSNYRIWDFLFKRKSPISFLRPLSNEPYIDVKFSANRNDISGFIRIAGEMTDARIKGNINIYGERLDVTGQVKDRAFSGEIKSKVGVFKVTGGLSEENELTANFTVQHLQIKGFDIVSDVTITNRFIRDAAGSGKDRIEGKISTKNLVVNYRPFLDISASYGLSDGLLEISQLDIGRDLRMYGKIYLNDLYTMDIVIVVDNTNISQAMANIGIVEKLPLSGILSGRFELKGPAGKQKLDAKMLIRDGQVCGVDFELLSARLRGEGAIIRIEESRITRRSGSFVLGGEMDLSKAGKGNMFEGVKMTSSDIAINWDGLDMKTIQDFQEVKMEKKMSDEVNVGYTRFENNRRIDESLRDKDEFELEYKLHTHDSLKLKVGEDKDFFGLAYEDRF
ncbi:MAG: hypothetical protein WC515_02215 [Candidatus Omnitrophota bacterium]